MIICQFELELYLLSPTVHIYKFPKIIKRWQFSQRQDHRVIWMMFSLCFRERWVPQVFYTIFSVRIIKKSTQTQLRPGWCQLSVQCSTNCCSCVHCLLQCWSERSASAGLRHCIETKCPLYLRLFFFSFSATYFSPRRVYHRVPKFRMGF